MVVGTGQRCTPHDRQQCGDGRPGPEATLWHPKGLTFGLDGSLYFADGNLIRVLDNTGIVRTVAGQTLATKSVPQNQPQIKTLPTTTATAATKSSPPPSPSSTNNQALKASLLLSSAIDCGKARLATQVRATRLNLHLDFNLFFLHFLCQKLQKITGQITLADVFSDITT